MKDLKQGSLEIILEEGEPNVMKWRGTSEEASPDAFLIPYFTEILESLKGKKLQVRFSELKYMNSSTVPPIVQFIGMLNAAGIHTKITYDSSSNWQLTSFKALENVVKAMNFIEVDGE